MNSQNYLINASMTIKKLDVSDTVSNSKMASKRGRTDLTGPEATASDLRHC